jgi:predicted nucleotidyltransferase
MTASYPTSVHAKAAQAIVDFFQTDGRAATVQLVNSCARGKATPDSCLDIVVVVEPAIFAHEGVSLEAQWQTFYQTDPIFKQLKARGAFSVVHLDIINGVYTPITWDDGGGPDGFELEIGNHLFYGISLWQQGDYLARLKAQWLPYYDETLRQHRLTMVSHACREDLAHIPLYAARGLYFAAFDRLYRASQEFLQALFISRRTYPIAYNKWMREQLVEILGLPAVYQQLTTLYELDSFTEQALLNKKEVLAQLMEDCGL